MEAPEFFVNNYFSYVGDDNNNSNNNNFTVDDLLDLPKEDEVMTDDAFFDSIMGNSADSSAVTVVDSCNSSISGGDGHFNGNLSCRSFNDAPFPSSELCVPYDDLADLEWLSNFVEESFSSDDIQNLQLIPATNINNSSTIITTAATTDSSSSATTLSTVPNSPPVFPGDTNVPGKARSKRSRAAPCDWSSRLQLLLSPTTSSSESNNSGNNRSVMAKATTKAPKKRENNETPGRKCLHCASEKTPQWRTGPMGPKTLCNACGVRYKSGRLVPEYRPAASPTFISAKHSNSHRKVMELRRQKELQRHQGHHHQQQHQLLSQTSIFDVSNGGDDYFIHHHQNSCGPNFRHHII